MDVKEFVRSLEKKINFNTQGRFKELGYEVSVDLSEYMRAKRFTVCIEKKVPMGGRLLELSQKGFGEIKEEHIVEEIKPYVEEYKIELSKTLIDKSSGLRRLNEPTDVDAVLAEEGLYTSADLGYIGHYLKLKILDRELDEELAIELSNKIVGLGE